MVGELHPTRRIVAPEWDALKRPQDARKSAALEAEKRRLRGNDDGEDLEIDDELLAELAKATAFTVDDLREKSDEFIAKLRDSVLSQNIGEMTVEEFDAALAQQCGCSGDAGDDGEDFEYAEAGGALTALEAEQDADRDRSSARNADGVDDVQVGGALNSIEERW